MLAIFRSAFDDWLRHRCPRLGAALAYYAVFSLGPLLLIVTAVAGLFFGRDAVRGSLSSQFERLIGPTGGKAVDAMIAGAESVSTGRTAAGVGLALLIVAALGVVVQMKDALNTIWEVDDPPDAAWSWYTRTYLVSFASVMALGLLLTVSLVVSAGLTAFGDWAGISAAENAWWQLANVIFSIAVLTLMFAMLYKFFPDTRVAWRDVWLGAASTAVLFEAGKFAIATYIGMQALESTYGAAASFVVLLIWIYYAAQIVLFGAEVTHAASQSRALIRAE